MVLGVCIQVLQLNRCVTYLSLCFALFNASDRIYTAELPGGFVAEGTDVCKMLSVQEIISAQ